MSNGYKIWLWDRESYGPRPVKGFFSQSDLERLRFQGLTRGNLTDFEIDRRIVDRSKSPFPGRQEGASKTGVR